MTGRPRVVLATHAAACILLLAPAASLHAQALRGGAQEAPLLELPAVNARPPASRVTASGRIIHPVLRRPAVAPALTPGTPLDLTRVGANGESFTQITPDGVNGGRQSFPVGPGLNGPSVLRVQVLLDRALFSPGMIDGGWGKNTSVSVYWFQAREGLTPTGVVDAETYERLEAAAGRPSAEVVRHVLTAGEVSGAFKPLPESIYAQARLDCLCYESLTEKLTETFHARAELLRQLNPGVVLNALKAGDAIWVPNVRDGAAPAKGTVETLVVNGPGHYLQALDGNGRILYHFPTTLGSSYDPSPEGSFHVLRITENPWWHYQPAILHHGHEGDPDAELPPGPNSAVGKVWITLDAGHYGIHGTKSPETIGYAVSAGCVRLTNWDALYLARRLTAGTAVVFRGTRTGVPVRTVNRAPPSVPAGPRVAGVRADSAGAKPTRVISVDSVMGETVSVDTTAAVPSPTSADSARRDSTRRDSSHAPATADTPAAKRAPAPHPAPPTTTKRAPTPTAPTRAPGTSPRATAASTRATVSPARTAGSPDTSSRTSTPTRPSTPTRTMAPAHTSTPTRPSTPAHTAATTGLHAPAAPAHTTPAGSHTAATPAHATPARTHPAASTRGTTAPAAHPAPARGPATRIAPASPVTNPDSAMKA